MGDGTGRGRGGGEGLRRGSRTRGKRGEGKVREVEGRDRKTAKGYVRRKGKGRGRSWRGGEEREK